MASVKNCFEDVVSESVGFFYATPTGLRSYQLSTAEEVTDHLNGPDHADFTCLVISICQRNSWRPLQVTKPMMDQMVSHFDMSPWFWDLPSCFYSRNLDLEEAFCIPYTQSRTGSTVEVSYTLRYPEFKTTEKNWVIRQTGIYHRFDTATRRSVYVLFSPAPNSKGHQMAREHLLARPAQEFAESPLWLHRELVATYCPAWRQYIAAHERLLLNIRNSTIASYIHQPLTVGSDSLGTLVSLEHRFLQVPCIMSHLTEVLEQLRALVIKDDRGNASSGALANENSGKLVSDLESHRRQCAAYSRNASYLHERAQTTTQLLAKTLSFRDQVISKEQNENMLRLNKSVVFITFVTLFYLPASFTFFGMNFFDLNDITGHLVASTMIWIYVVSALALTAATFLFYYWLLWYDGNLPNAMASRLLRLRLRGDEKMGHEKMVPMTS